MGSSSRHVLYQATHCRVANSTSSIDRQGPLHAEASLYMSRNCGPNLNLEASK